MKCKNCGADYKASELMCPFCGTRNATGEEWLAEEQQARRQKEQTKHFVVSSMPLYIANRILNTIIGIGVALLVILLVVLFVGCFFEEQIKKRSFSSASVATAEEIYQTGDWVKLDDYLTEHEVWFYDESDAYEKYKEVAMYYRGWIETEEDILRYYDASEEKIEEDLEFGPVANAFESCQELISHHIFYFQTYCEENQPIYEEFEETVKAFLIGELLLTEDEIEEISEVSYMSMEEENAWVRKIYERKGWEIRETD